MSVLLLFLVFPLLLAPVVVLPAVFLVVTLQRRRHARDPPAALVVCASAATHSPRVLAHVRALAASPLPHVPILLAHGPSPLGAGTGFVELSRAGAGAHGRTAWALVRKLVRTTGTLAAGLWRAAGLPYRIEHVIVNTPPALPVLPAVLLLRAALFPGARVTVDWHNTAASLMRTTGTGPAVVRVAQWAELQCARWAHAHWTVSHALREYLEDAAAVQARVVYDRPTARFAAILREAGEAQGGRAAVLRETRRVAKRMGCVREERDWERCAVVVSSTSWTADEDFSVLVEAIRGLDRRGCAAVVVVTGRGPLRGQFEREIDGCGLGCVEVWTGWVSEELYPRVVAAADVGVSLHVSSSGLDLPMKVVDMLACGTGVVARRFACIGELVVDGETGVLFDDARQLERALWDCLVGDVPKWRRVAARIREVFARDDMRWQATWERCAMPALAGPAATRGEAR